MSEKKAGNKKDTHINKTLYLDRDLITSIEDLMAVERPFPTFTEMAVKLLRIGVDQAKAEAAERGE